MTEQQKKALGEIRAANERAIQQATLFEDQESLGCAAIITRNLDAIEADGKCKYTERFDGKHRWECDKCGDFVFFTDEIRRCCPSCGREVEQ